VVGLSIHERWGYQIDGPWVPSSTKLIEDEHKGGTLIYVETGKHSRFGALFEVVEDGEEDSARTQSVCYVFTHLLLLCHSDSRTDETGVVADRQALVKQRGNHTYPVILELLRRGFGPKAGKPATADGDLSNDA
jgi:hypothetical protein